MPIDLRAREAMRVQWRADGWYPDLTIGEALASGADDHGSAEIVFAPVHGEAGATSLKELHDHALQIAGSLHRSGVTLGDVVIVRTPANPTSTAVLCALWQLGAVVVPLPMTASEADLSHVIGETGARVVIDEATSFDNDGPVVSELDRPSPADVACILYTSGSTAMPKGVQHSHETLLFGLTAAPADPATRTLATFPAGHVASLMSLLRPLVVGGTTVVMDRWSARHAAALIERYRITTSAGTPFFLSTLLDEADRSGCDISSLKAMLCGAAAVPPALVERAVARGIVSWRTYGSTEHPAISGGSPSDPPEKRQFTDGRVGFGNEVRLVDEDGSDVAPGDEGEIVARGPKQFLGYRDASLNDDAFLDGSWFRTGDVARLDPDGYVVVTGRMKDIVIRGGENISAREVEDVLSAHPSVDEVAVCAIKDEVWGEVVGAFVIARDVVEPPTLDDLIAFALDQGLAKHKVPALVAVVSEFPRTSAGKVLKRELRSLAT